LGVTFLCNDGMGVSSASGKRGGKGGIPNRVLRVKASKIPQKSHLSRRGFYYQRRRRLKLVISLYLISGRESEGVKYDRIPEGLGGKSREKEIAQELKGGSSLNNEKSM